MYWLNLTSLPANPRGQSGIMKRSLYGSDATYQASINGSGDVGSTVAGEPDFSYHNAHWHDRTATTAITAGIWHLLTFVFDGSTNTASLYVDGTNASANAYTDGVAVAKEDEGLNTAFTSILRFNSGTATSTVDQKLTGVMDEVRIYNYALSASEIASYYDSTR